MGVYSALPTLSQLILEQPHEFGTTTTTTPNLQMRKLSCREIKWLP